jgi:hypothetical protein
MVLAFTDAQLSQIKTAASFQVPHELLSLSGSLGSCELMQARSQPVKAIRSSAHPRTTLVIAPILRFTDVHRGA